MREVEVHAANREEALSDGAAALGVHPRQAEVEILSEDEDGVTARVVVPDVPPASLGGVSPPARDGESAAGGDAQGGGDESASDAEEGDAPQVVREHLQTVLDLMGLEAQAELVASEDEELTFNVVGGDLGVIIGTGGQTLNALQFLLNLMASRGGRRRRVTVDAEGYRDRRRRRLEEVAAEHARRAKSERRPVILEGLRAAERRIIHTALQHDPDVVTYSEGEEPHRRLIITPRD